MNKGLVWMLHSVEADSPRTANCEIFRNLTISPAALEQKIAAARADGWTFVSGAEFLRHKRDGAEHKDILITIDDGFRNIYTEAYPLFRRLGVPFVFYVATGLIEKGFRVCRYAQLDGMLLAIDEALARGKDPNLCFRMYRRLKRYLPFVDGRRILTWILGRDLPFERYFREAVVSPAELREMVESGLCEVGSHTDTHVHADRCRALEWELTESKRKIEAWTGRPCESFSYPYGHCNACALDLVRRHFVWATQDVREPPYGVTEASDDHRLPRMIVVQ